MADQNPSPKFEIPEPLRQRVREGVEKFLARIASRAAPHQEVGRILTSHLLFQHQLNEYVEEMNPNLGRVSKLRRLLPIETLLLLAAGPPERPDGLIEVLRPGIVEINKLRNRLAHEIAYLPTKESLPQIYKTLHHSYPEMEIEKKSPVEVIAVFTAYACMSMVVFQEEYKYFGRARDERAKRLEELVQRQDQLVQRLVELIDPKPQDPEPDPQQG